MLFVDVLAIAYCCCSFLATVLLFACLFVFAHFLHIHTYIYTSTYIYIYIYTCVHIYICVVYIYIHRYLHLRERAKGGFQIQGCESCRNQWCAGGVLASTGGWDQQFVRDINIYIYIPMNNIWQLCKKRIKSI